MVPVTVHFKHGAGKVFAGGELALEGVRGPAVEQETAAPLPVHRHVAQRHSAAQVQAS